MENIKLLQNREGGIVMSSMTVKSKNDTLLVSKWDKRILDNKKRRKAEIRKHFFQFIFAVGFVCVAFFSINSMISKAGDVEEEELSFKYYKNICMEQGETLTSIAREYADREHYETLDQYIQEVVYMNHLKSEDDICAGYYLIIPYYSNELL